MSAITHRHTTHFFMGPSLETTGLDLLTQKSWSCLHSHLEDFSGVFQAFWLADIAVSGVVYLSLACCPNCGQGTLKLLFSKFDIL